MIPECLSLFSQFFVKICHKDASQDAEKLHETHNKYNIVTHKPIARQRLAKHIPVGAKRAQQ
jgi:hypothetical protein